jgi:hypothetical protein
MISTNITGANEMGGACGTCGREDRYIQDLVGKPEEKRPLGKPRRRWEDNIKMYFEDVECETCAGSGSG